MLAGVPYVLWPVGSLFILASRKKSDPFLHYHAVQGLLWGAFVAVATLLGGIGLAIVFRVMPGSSTYLWGMLGMGTLFGVIAVAMMVFFTAIFLGWRATEGEMLRLPFLGDYAEGKMLDHTGMTRAGFLQMLEDSFIEPNPPSETIPFPAVVTPRLTGKAAEVMASRSVEDATPASLKAVEILALRAARGSSELREPAPASQLLASQNGRSNQQAPRQVAASPPSATQGPTRAPIATTPVRQPSQPVPPVPQQQRPPTSAAQTPRPPVAQSPRPPAAQPPRPPAPAAQQRPPSPAPQRPQVAAQNADGPQIKSYPLNRDGAPPAASHVLQPSPPQRSPQPPQRAQAPAGWQQSPGGGQPPMPPAQSVPGQVSNAQVKEVDLVRHYKERRDSAQQQSDVLRNWLTSVDDTP